MGNILDRVRGRKSNTIPASASFRITEQGKDKLQGGIRGDPKSRILVTLETEGTCTVSDLCAARDGVTKGQAERLLPILVRGGFVQYASAAAESDY